MAIIDQLIAYTTQVSTDISTETTADSLDPSIIGSMGTDLADILKDFLPKQNNFIVTAGTDFPLGGGDTDLYFRYIAGNIQVYRNIIGIWTELATIPISFGIPDGIMVGLRLSVLSQTVTITPGAYIIDNAKYSVDVQTQFTLDPADLSFDRWDLVYADKFDDLIIITGTPTLVPIKPDLPTECIVVDYIYIPAVGLPYALSSPPFTSISPEPLVALASAQIAGIFNVLWNDAKVSQFGVYGRFKVEQAGTYQDVPITINKDITTNKPTSYDFNLSGIDSLIHII